MISTSQVQQLLQQALQHQQRGDLNAAEDLCRRILAEQTNAHALSLLGSLALTRGQPDAARRFLEQAIQLEPESVQSHLNLSIALNMLGRSNDAIRSARRAVHLRPDIAESRYIFANFLRHAQLLDEALAECRRALELRADYFDALVLLSDLELQFLHPQASVQAADRAIALRSDVPLVHWNKAIAALTSGDFKIGWEEYEWRFQYDRLPQLNRAFQAPIWHRQDLSGKRILLYCEGGFGDAFHFIRFLPWVLERAKTVYLECFPEILDLFKLLPGPAKVIAKGDPLPDTDYFAPLQSLPLNFGLTVATIPANVPYLQTHVEKVEAWRARPAQLPNGKLNVGLVWAGSKSPIEHRSRALSIYDPLAQIPGVRFISLQKGPDAQQARRPSPGMDLVDFTDELHDFSDTAALIQNLDLVITVDTSIAHLAGALAKPVWTLISYVPDFRWLLDREDSPWYPTMRLFRQTNRGGWNDPVARLATELKKRVKS